MYTKITKKEKEKGDEKCVCYKREVVMDESAMNRVYCTDILAS